MSVHVGSESVFILNQNRCSRSSGIGVHVESEWVFMFDRNTQRLHREASLGPEDIRWLNMIGDIANEKNQADSQVRALQRRSSILKIRFQNNNGKDLLGDLENIEKHLEYLLGQNSKNSLFDADAYELGQIANHHLPQAIDNYLKLPVKLANEKRLKNGKTASESFIEQIGLLEDKLSKMADGVYKDDAREVVLHGQFIKEKFSQSIFDFEE